MAARAEPAVAGPAHGHVHKPDMGALDASALEAASCRVSSVRTLAFQPEKPLFHVAPVSGWVNGEHKCTAGPAGRPEAEQCALPVLGANASPAHARVPPSPPQTPTDPLFFVTSITCECGFGNWARDLPRCLVILRRAGALARPMPRSCMPGHASVAAGRAAALTPAPPSMGLDAGLCLIKLVTRLPAPWQRQLRWPPSLARAVPFPPCRRFYQHVEGTCEWSFGMVWGHFGKAPRWQHARP